MIYQCDLQQICKKMTLIFYTESHSSSQWK